MSARARSSSVRRLVVLAICAIALIVLPGTRVWATARSVGARTLAFVERTIAPAFGFRASPADATLVPSVTAVMTTTLTTDSGGDSLADPGDVIRYSTTITNSGTDATGARFLDTIAANTTLVGGSIVVSPIAYHDTYQSVGNMTLDTSTLTNCIANALYSVTCNDLLNGGSVTAFGDSLANAGVTTANGTNTVTTAHGTVTMNTDGSFVYNPVAGYEGDDEFYYTAANTSVTPNLTDVGRVTITVGGTNGMAWFVASGGAGGGRQANPINLDSLRSINNGTGTNPASGDTIFLLEGNHSLTAALPLLGTQKLIGQDTTATLLTLGAPLPRPGNSYPAVNNPSGTPVSIVSFATALTLGSDNTLAGFSVGLSTTGITGGAAGLLRVRDVAINSGGPAFVITGSATILTDVNFTGFTEVTSNGGLNGVSLTGVNGIVNLGTGSLSGNAGVAFNVSGGDATISYAGTIQNSGSRQVSIIGKTGGGVTLSGAVGGTGTGIFLDNNAQAGTATIAFTGGVTVSTGSNAAFTATDGGIVTMTGSGNTLATTSGQAVLMTGVTIGGTNVSFATIASGSVTNADALSFSSVTGGTFNAGAVTVAGTTTSGDGIEINGSSAVFNFASATIDNTVGAGVNLTGANGAVTFTTVDIDGTGGAGVAVTNNTSAVSINGGTIGATNDPAGNVVDIDQGSADVTVAAALTKGNGGVAGMIVDITNRTSTATVDISGQLTCALTCTGINVQNNISGTSTINFSHGTKNLNTGGMAAVTLNNNDNATINFTNGGLHIETTSGTGFSAINGAAGVNVTGAGNTIASMTGTALNIANTTIGANDVTFLSISANGASSGIVLNTTGTSGGLTVTGDGVDGNTTPDSLTSGGTIQNTTSHGVSLTSTMDVYLGGMTITSVDGSGISGSSVNGFVLDTVSITLNGDSDAADESGINLTGLSGTSSGGLHPTAIRNSTVSNNHEFEVQITNSSGTLADFQITNSTVSSNGATAVHGNLFNFLSVGTASMGLTVSGSTFDGNTVAGALTGTAVHVDASGGSISADVGTSNFIDNNVAVNMSTATTGTLDFDIHNNAQMTGNRGTGINVFSNANFTGTITGSITGNTVGTQGVASSGSLLGRGVQVSMEGGGTATLLINNNIVQSVADFEGISVVENVTVGVVNATITNNITRDIAGDRGIIAQVTNAGTFNASISGNQFINVVGLSGTVMRVNEGINGGTLNIVQLAPTAAAVANELDDANNVVNTLVLVSGTPQFGQAAPPLPLLAAEGGVEAAGAQVPAAPVVDDRLLTQAELDVVVPAARTRWNTTGLTGLQSAALQRLEFKVDDLSGRHVGAASPGHIAIGRRAGGYDWYIDGTPDDDVEFTESASPTRLYTTPQGAPAGRMDLLSAVMHEIGHQLGLADSYAAIDRDSLMFGHLTTGERRLPSFGQAARATTTMAFHVADPLGRAGDSLVALWRPAPVPSRGSAFVAVRLPSPAPLVRWVSSQLRSAVATTLAAVRRVPDLLSATLEARSGETVDVPIGTGLLPGGKSVTIVFSVSVDAPPVASYANQATISSTTASFSDVLSNTVTTTGDLYDTTTAVTSDINPAEQGQVVTFTATVTPSEGSTTPDGTVNFDFGASGVANGIACAAAGSTCTAQVTHQFATGGDFQVTASYQGGTNHDPSTSSAVTQAITACTVNPIVTNNADDGPGSLRDALANACSGPGFNTITFDCTVVSPITLTSGELSLAKNVVISGPGASTMTITRDAGAGPFRIFHNQPNVTATISGLTVSNGSATLGPQSGGGILNEDGTLTLQSMVVTGNSAGGPGSGVANATSSFEASATITILDSTIHGNGSGGTGPGGGLANYAAGQDSTLAMTIRRSTISGNGSGSDGGALRNYPFRGNIVVTATDTTFSGNSSAADGGAISNRNEPGRTTQVTLINSTVTGNQSNVPPAGGTGGGIYNNAGTVTLLNTIVAGNNNGDVVGTVTSSFNNLIGNGDAAGGLTDGVDGNLVGTGASPIDPRLDPLSGNGGPTQTHALLPGSPALDAGNNSYAFGSSDQRGGGFQRVRDGADAGSIQTVDIGAFEAQVSLPDLPDQVMVEDQPTPLSIVFPVGHIGVISSVTASNSTPGFLVPGPNLTVTGGNSSPQTLTITPPANAFGTASVKVTVNSGLGSMADSFLLTVTGVNDPPTLDAIPNPAAIAEDSGEQTVNLSTITAGPLESQTLVVTATSDNTALIPHPTVTYTSPDTSGSLSYTPVPNASGSAIITVTVDDGGDDPHTVTQTFTVVVDPVAETPSVPSSVVTDEDVAATIVINRNAGDGAEVTHFQLTGITPVGSLFQSDGMTPIVDNDFITVAQGNAGLKFKLPPNASGTGQITVQSSLSNLVGGLGGGLAIVDITVNSVADTPTVTDSTTTLNTQTVDGLVIDKNAVDGTEVTHFKITSITNGTLFQFDGGTPINNNDFITLAEGNAGLKFSPTPDSAATGSFRVQGALDNVGTGLSTGFATATITLPCTPNPVVLNNADGGPDSLRMALGLACAGSSITFDPGLMGSTIGLISGPLTIDKDVTIDGLGANQLTVARLDGFGSFRLIDILPGHIVTIRGLTLTNGSHHQQGGAILNTGSALTIENSALTGNTANDGFGGGQGGAIYNDGNPTSASLTIVNSTLSGNQVGQFGGAVRSIGHNGGTGTVTLTNSTVSGNTASMGGGLFIEGSDAAHAFVTITNSTITNNRGTFAFGGLSMGFGILTLRNTIVAGNFSDAGTDPSDVAGTVNTLTSFNNLIGVDGVMSGMTHGVNGNQIGTAASPLDARLGPLQDNGGPTQTHALLAGSPALDAGSDAFVVAPPFLDPLPFTTDQRGAGFDRIVDAADVDPTLTVDIGAFEAGAAVEDIADQATAEETLLSFLFQVSGAATSVTASSDNSVLVPNVPANLEVLGGGSLRLLNITPALDQTGTATITVTVTSTTGSMSDTFVLTVGGVNDQPTLDLITDPVAINEDAPLQIVNLTGISAGDSESQTLVVTATSDNPAVIPDPSVIYFSPDAFGLLTYTPVPDASGSAIITVTVNDGGGGAQTIQRTFTVTVNPVNDPPTLDAIADRPAIDEDGVLQIVQLAGISAGGGETQLLSVTATSNNTALIPDPAVTYLSANTFGSLAYTPVANANGTATITVTVNDGGGGTQTFSRTFTVTVNAVNDLPTLDAIPDPAAILEDAGLQTVNLTGIAAGAGESQTLTVTATSSNTALIPNPTVIYTSPNTTGSLTYTPIADANGSAVITVTVDDGGTGTNTVVRTFTVTVTSVNDAPTLDAIPNPLAILEDAGLQAVNLSGISAGGGESQTLMVTATSNNTGLIPNPTVLYTSANATGSLTYAPAANMNGSAIITVTVDDNGTGTHTVTRTFTVQVAAENDLPTIVPIAPQLFAANTSRNVSATIGDAETPVSALLVTASSSNQTVIPNSGLVVTGSGATRTLTMTPAAGQAGSATITVSVNDGTGGVTTTSFLALVLPSLTIGDAMVFEGNGGTVNLLFPVTLTGPSAGPVSVNYATRQRTAIGNVDYTTSAGTLMLSGATGTITIPVLSDTTAEIHEDFFVELSSPIGALLGDAQAVGTIVNDDLTPPTTAQRVDWTRRAGTTAATGTLTKTGGVDGWNAGGSSSTRAIAAGDGSVEFSVLSTDDGVALGLSRGDTNTELSDIDFAIVPFLGQIYVAERGVPPQGTFGPYAAGDRFAVVVSGGVVSYQHNGVTFYTSTVAPHYPLLVDGALYTADATLADVVFAGPLTTTPRRQADYDGDGQTDVVIYRPSSGTWFTLHSGADHTEYTAVANGDVNSITMPGDYDGDGVADLAVYQPASGNWNVLRSSTYFTTSLTLTWGAAGDVPVPGDYDGDGTADPAVFRPATGTWFILQSSTGYATFSQTVWGNSADITVPGDYDGDSKADLAIFRPSSGTWFILKSSTGYATFSQHVWGASTDITVPGDFDGDGKFDPTVYRPSTGEWFSLRSSTNYTTYLQLAWGAAGTDVPVMGDYDGDGKADVAIYRPSTGTWFVLRSADSYATYMSFLWGFGAQYPALRRP